MIGDRLIMIRKIATPVAFFLFGILIAYLESGVLELPVDSNDVSHNGVNLFNRIIFLVVLGLLLVFEVRTQFKKIKSPAYKYSYLLITVLLLVSIAYYWIQLLVIK